MGSFFPIFDSKNVENVQRKLFKHNVLYYLRCLGIGIAFCLTDSEWYRLVEPLRYVGTFMVTETGGDFFYVAQSLPVRA